MREIEYKFAAHKRLQHKDQSSFPSVLVFAELDPITIS